MQAFVNDNPNLNPVLEQLRSISDVLVARKDDLAQSLKYVGQFAASLGETVASGPYFKIVLSNLLPYWILQPWVDAAFKKRGIDPEDFWRSAGLPAFKFPDPNGTRFPNGAPPPAPPVLEGTPDHPGPAVAPGLAVLVRAAAGAAATAGQPDAMCGRRSRARSLRAQRAVSGVARRRIVAAEPQRPAPDTGHPDRRATRGAAAGRAGYAGAAAAERTTGGTHRSPGTGRSAPPPSTFAPGLPPGPGRRRDPAATAGSVHQPGWSGR